MASTEAIASATAAGNSSAITLASGESVSVWADTPLQNGEFVRLERSNDGGTTWFNVNDEEYSGRVLDSKRNTATVNGPGVFRLHKMLTCTATAVYYD